MSKFKVRFLTLILLATLLPVTYVHAAEKSPEGQVCKKKSAITLFGTNKYICKLVGKKLIWRLQIKTTIAPAPAVLTWTEIEAKAAAEKAIADALAAAAREAAEKAAAEAKIDAEAKAAAEKAAILAAQKPAVAGLQIGNLLWSEDFLGSPSDYINSKYWTARNCHRVPISSGGGACFGIESQYYAPSAISLDGSKDGAAVISTTRAQENKPADAGKCLGDFGCKFVSGRFDTHEKVSFLYGYIEARIKMPSGSGNHPAFWMLGDNINSVGWPTSGEMDITEIHSNVPNETTAAINYSTIYSPNNCCRNAKYITDKIDLGADVSQEYHLYAIAWLPDSISYYADNKLVFQISRTEFETNYGYWSFDKSFFIILNNAVSEGFSGSSANLQSSTMSIDWVRSYQVNGFGQVTIK